MNISYLKAEEVPSLRLIATELNTKDMPMPDEFPFDRVKKAYDNYRRALRSLLIAMENDSPIDGIKLAFKNYLSALNVLRIASVDLSFLPWILKKRAQTFARTRLSHYVALSLVAIIIYRERLDVLRFLSEWKMPDFEGYLILAGLIGTFIAAKLELWHNKRTTSPQEIRFQFNFGTLLDKLHALADMKGSTEDVEQRFSDFVTTLLQLAADTFSVDSRVETGLMLALHDEQLLKLASWSSGAHYDPNLTVPIPARGDLTYAGTGPAGVAFAKRKIVYLPNKKREIPQNAWPVRWLEEVSGKELFVYRPLRPHKCWKPSTEAEQEAFRSVLCVPIEKFGVLNFSTESLDPLIGRDFHMAQCFASILEHGFQLLDTGRLVAANRTRAATP